MASIFDRASEMFDKSMDAASDLFDKSKEAANDFASQAGDLATRGKIKAKLVDQGLEYDRLMRKLGSALYEQLKDDPKYAETNQALFAEIARCVQRKQDLEDELYAAEAAADAARPVDVTPVKPDGDRADVAATAQQVASEDGQAAAEKKEKDDQ